MAAEIPRIFTAKEIELCLAFIRFHILNPHVYRRFCKMARDQRRAGGATYLSGWQIITEMRSDVTLVTRGAGFKLTNNFIPFYTRLWQRDNPRDAWLFDTHPAAADWLFADPTVFDEQLALMGGEVSA
jgi:hypothetical protein